MGNNLQDYSIIVACIGLVASAVTASLSYYFTKKQQLQMEERRLKEEYYKSFIKAISDVALDNNSKEAQERLSEGFNSLLLVSDTMVVQKLMAFHEYTSIGNKTSRNSEGWIKKHDELLAELVKAMRIDLFGRKKGVNKDFPPIHLVGKTFK